MSNAEQNKALVASFFDILNRNDVPALLDLYAEDGEVTTMGQTLISGTSGKEAASDLFNMRKRINRPTRMIL